MKFLTDEERCQLKAQHKKERDKRICDRIKAVLLYNKDWTPAAIAEALLLSDDAIRGHIDEYKESKKLKPISGGSEEKLSTEKAAELEFHLKTHTYLYVKDIIAHVKITYDIEYSFAGILNWLHKHGFSYKKPSIVPGKANQQLQKNWIAEYEKLKQNLLDDETIGFMDGVHPTHNVQTACGWIKKGERKELLGNTGRS